MKIYGTCPIGDVRYAVCAGNTTGDGITIYACVETWWLTGYWTLVLDDTEILYNVLF